MDRPPTGAEFAELLQAIRIRSGLSYEELARRTFTSRSTLHRYCTGAGLPGDGEFAARLGTACGAEPDEITELTRRWKHAVAARAEQDARPGPAPAPPRPTANPRPVPARRHGPRRMALRSGAAVLVGIGIGGVGVALFAGSDGSRTDTAAGRPADVCVARPEIRHADGPTGTFQAVWTGDEMCPNRPDAPLFISPVARADDATARVGTMRSTRSWFVCWTLGRPHAGGNRIWYYTQGDVAGPSHKDRQAWGFMPARFLDTERDPDPGLPECPAAGNTRGG